MTDNPTDSQLEAILRRIAFHWSNFEGVATLSPTAPQQIDEMPAVVFTAGPATYQKRGNLRMITREIQMILAMNTAEGDLQMTAEANTLPYIDSVVEYFEPLDRLQTEEPDSAIVADSTIVRDSGAGPFTYAGREYIGCIFYLSVTYPKAIRRI
jgi:hypothetical protein